MRLICQYFAGFLLVGGIPYNKLNTLVFLTQVKNQEQSLDFFEGKLTSFKKIKHKKLICQYFAGNKLLFLILRGNSQGFVYFYYLHL
jgi:hypothetical protein